VFLAHVAKVGVCASPDDTGRFHTAIGRALTGWNSTVAERHNVMLVPCLGHRSAADRFDECDVLIGIFDPVQRNAVDVLGDLVRAKHAGKLALAWLVAESPPDRSSKVDDVGLRVLAERLMVAGIRPQYIGHRDLHVESLIRGALADDLNSSRISTLAAGFDSLAAARQIIAYRTPVPLLGPEIWAVTVVNHGSALAIELTVGVNAVDGEGNEVPGGASRSTQELADVFARLRSSTRPDAASSDPAFAFPATRMELLAAHTALDFPRWLRPNQRASALFELQPDASLRVHIEFEDYAGDVWSRTNDAAPERVRQRGAVITR
jgi:hypothetical protein